MVKKNMYRKIQELKKRGLCKTKVAEKLGIDRATSSKYYGMSEIEFRKYFQGLADKDKYMARYKEDILDIYRANEFRKLNMSSVFDFLEEKFGMIDGSEKSLRNYIHFLIKNGQLTLKENIRIYQKVPPLPFGRQLQIDFGQYKFLSGLKLYIFAAVLSACRYKYASFQTQPFRTKDVILHLLDCFDYIGGLPEELVIDQDKLMVVSENKGDIIFTKDFQYFIEEMDLKMYVCRKADPETKGKIENLIKFIKYNFLEPRNFEMPEEAQESLSNWLVRRANGKISQATKMIPEELIETERGFLRSPKASIFRKDDLLYREERTANDKAYITVNGTPYSVPENYRSRVVEIFTTLTKLFIFDVTTGRQLAEHDLSMITGVKVTDRNHFRQKESKVKSLKEEVKNLYDFENWRNFVERNFKKFSRYCRDQCIDAKKHFGKDINVDLLKESVTFCLENSTLSFSALKDTYEYFLRENQDPPEIIVALDARIKLPSVDVHKRPLSTYKEVISRRTQ